MKGFPYVLTLAIVLAASPLAVSGTPSGAPGDPDGPNVPSNGPVGEPVAAPEEEAKVVVDAPHTGKVGELIRFDLTQSVADSVKWIVRPTTVDFQTYDDGRRAVFSARHPGEYLFIIAVAKAGSVDVVTHMVTIKGPPKEPTEPDLTQWVPYWLYPLQLPKEEALALAQSFEDTADRITSLSTPKGIIAATAEANRATLGGSLDAWKPLLKKLQSAMKNRARDGTLATPDQHKEMWLEIARGLRRYAE